MVKNMFNQNQEEFDNAVRQDAMQRLIQQNAMNSIEERPKVQKPLAVSRGRFGRGNIDLYKRPQYVQPDGSVSTVNSMSFGTEDGEVLVPTIDFDDYGQPRQLTADEAMDRYYRTGEYLGKFNTIEEADSYADLLHRQQESFYRRR